MSLEQRVIEYLQAHPGKKAREVAEALGEEKPAVNSCLYRLRGRSVEQVAGFRWRVLEGGGGERRGPAPAKTSSNTPLARLSRFRCRSFSLSIGLPLIEASRALMTG